MKPLLGIALVLVVGLIASHRWVARDKRGRWTRYVYRTGEEFLLLGLMLGPLGANLLDRDVLAGLEPFVGLGLGYIGFAFGMQFEGATLRRIPAGHYGASLLHGLMAGGVVVWGLGVVGYPGSAAQAPWAVALAATALGTSTSFLFLVDRRTRLGRSSGFRFLRFTAVFEDLVGVLGFGLVLCWAQDDPWSAVLVSVGLAFVATLLLLLVLRARLPPDEELLVLVGTILLCGGTTAYLRLSPVLTCTLAGILFGNLHPAAVKVHERLLQMERPIYLFMVVVAGAMWSFRPDMALLGVGGMYLLARVVGKLGGGLASARLLGEPLSAGSLLGLGGLPQSEMAVALLVNLLVLFPGPQVQLGVSAVFLAIVMNDVAGMALYARIHGGEKIP